MSQPRSRFPQHWSPDRSRHDVVPANDEDEYDAVWSDVPWPVLERESPARPEEAEPEPRIADARARRQASRQRTHG